MKYSHVAFVCNIGTSVTLKLCEHVQDIVGRPALPSSDSPRSVLFLGVNSCRYDTTKLELCSHSIVPIPRQANDLLVVLSCVCTIIANSGFEPRLYVH